MPLSEICKMHCIGAAFKKKLLSHLQKTNKVRKQHTFVFMYVFANKDLQWMFWVLGENDSSTFGSFLEKYELQKMHPNHLQCDLPGCLGKTEEVFSFRKVFIVTHG